MTTPFNSQSDRVYVLSRAFCRDGTVSGTRKQRLTCALVELRDRIQEEFESVSKTWQVSAEDLRGCYSYAYPASVPGAPDPLMLERACEELMRYLRNEIQTQAKQFGVPDNLVEQMLVDWLVSDAMESERIPSAWFIPEGVVAPTTRSGDAKPEDVLPSVKELLTGRPRRGASPGGPKELEQSVNARLCQPLIGEAVDGD